jgi:hypothetical protein
MERCSYVGRSLNFGWVVNYVRKTQYLGIENSKEMAIKTLRDGWRERRAVNQVLLAFKEG